MHMPVMDGLEAAAKILELDTGIPIVAMTANIMSNDREIYRKSGMRDCVGKPFTSQELWHCLMKYLHPVYWQSVDEGRNIQKNRNAGLDVQQTLQKLFAKHNMNKFEEIADALEMGDLKLAHRLVHTLKGNAGQLGKPVLQKAAADIERYIKEGNIPVPTEQLSHLETELKAVLRELSPLLDES